MCSSTYRTSCPRQCISENAKSFPEHSHQLHYRRKKRRFEVSPVQFALSPIGETPDIAELKFPASPQDCPGYSRHTGPIVHGELQALYQNEIYYENAGIILI